MARQAVGDGQEMFRVVVVRKQMKVNPAYERGVYDPKSNPHYIPDGDKTGQCEYGPYNSLGTARGQRTHHSTGYGAHTVVKAWIEKASTAWGVVA